MKRPYISMEDRKWYRDNQDTFTAQSFWFSHYVRQVFRKGIINPFEKALNYFLKEKV